MKKKKNGALFTEVKRKEKNIYFQKKLLELKWFEAIVQQSTVLYTV